MFVDVDESRRDDETFCIDDFFRLSIQSPYGRNLIAFNPDIGNKGWP
jgi:hypothetical protein